MSNPRVTYQPDDDTTYEWTAETLRDPANVIDFIETLVEDADPNPDSLVRTKTSRPGS